MKSKAISFTPEVLKAKLRALEEYGHCQYRAARYDTPPQFATGDMLHFVEIRDIVGYVGLYGAGDDGGIYRMDGARPRKLSPANTGSGYKSITFCKNGIRKTGSVHRLVCEAFYGPCPSWASEVRHLDGDATNNDPCNLDWGTQQQNWGDKRALGHSIHSNHHAAILGPGDVAMIRSSREPATVLARRLGVSDTAVRSVRQGKTWRSPPPADPPNMSRHARHFLEVVDVRAERVVDISEKDALLEGIERQSGEWAIASYFALYDSIYGHGAHARDWCWVYTLKRATP